MDKTKILKFYDDFKELNHANPELLRKQERILKYLLNKELLDENRPLEYSLKISKHGIINQRLVLYSKKGNTNIDRMNTFASYFGIDYYKNNRYFNRYCYGFEKDKDIVKTKLYFMLKDITEENKNKILKFIIEKYKIKNYPEYRHKKLECIGIKNLENEYSIDYYTKRKPYLGNLEHADKRKIFTLNQIKKGKTEKVYCIENMTKKNKIRILVKKKKLRDYLKENKKFFIDNGLTAKYLTVSEDSIKAYFRIDNESEMKSL